MEVLVKDNGNGIYSCFYVFRKLVKYIVMVFWGGVSIFNSFFRVNVGVGSYFNKVKVYGFGVVKIGFKVYEFIYFIVDCVEVG